MGRTRAVRGLCPTPAVPAPPVPAVPVGAGLPKGPVRFRPSEASRQSEDRRERQAISKRAAGQVHPVARPVRLVRPDLALLARPVVVRRLVPRAPRLVRRALLLEWRALLERQARQGGNQRHRRPERPRPDRHLRLRRLRRRRKWWPSATS
jgi:hypothetical protein